MVGKVNPYTPAVGRFKWGVVSQRKADPKGPLVKVLWDDLDGLESHWLRVGQRKTLQDKHYHLPDIGEQVGCLLDEHCEDGVVVCAIYSDEDLPPTTNPDVEMVRFKDGTVVAYDRAAHAMAVNCVGTIAVHSAGQISVSCDSDITVTGATSITINAASSVSVSAPAAAVSANTITLNGKTTCTGELIVEGLFTTKGGISMLPPPTPPGAPKKVTKVGTIGGDIEVTGDMVVDGKINGT